MSSYVTVLGKPTGETSCIFGLTPQEIRYLQSKFPEQYGKHEDGWNPKHGIRLECTCVVALNALGYIGFKVVTTSGDCNEYMWTLERNLDMDTQYQSRFYDYGRPPKYAHRPQHSNSDDGTGGCIARGGGGGEDGSGGCLAPPKSEHRRHSLTERIAHVLHL